MHPGIVALWLAVSSAANPAQTEATVESARAALAEIRFDEALRIAEAALARGGHSPEAVADLFAIIAQASAGMGYEDAARIAYERLLQLQPSFDLPPTTSPRLLTPLLHARERLKGEFLRIVPESAPVSPSLIRTTAEVHGDLHRLVVSAQVHVLPGQKVVPLARTERFIGEWECVEPRCTYFVAVVDRFGNTLASAGSPAAPLTVLRPSASGQPLAASAQPSAAVSGSSGADSEAWFTRPAPYAALAGVLAATGGYFAWRLNDQQQRLIAMNAERHLHRREELVSLDADRRRDHAFMWGAFGAAAGFGAVAFLVW